ncbi:MAG: hypothetical protein R2713_00415 [Ilumatobacteraceae bacterium]
MSWIAGLETAERPQFADTAAARCSPPSAVGGALAAALVGWQLARPARLAAPALRCARLDGARVG